MPCCPGPVLLVGAEEDSPRDLAATCQLTIYAGVPSPSAASRSPFSASVSSRPSFKTFRPLSTAFVCATVMLQQDGSGVRGRSQKQRVDYVREDLQVAELSVTP